MVEQLEESKSLVLQNELSVAELQNQVNKVQKIMKSVMKEDEHYGTIPGTAKPTLYKAGAEKLNFVFRLAPKFEKDIVDFENGHREFSFICRLIHINSESVIAEGVGSCSTLESKYRYRWDDTGKEVPKDYWKYRNQDLIGGNSFAARKKWVEGDNGKKKQIWNIFQKVEFEDPADYYNTCLKIGKKRALIDATLTATAASDIFVQDADDLETVPNGDHEHDYSQEPSKPPVTTPELTEDENLYDMLLDIESIMKDKEMQDAFKKRIEGFLKKKEKSIKQASMWLTSLKALPDKK